jgi:hypothetical protein
MIEGGALSGGGKMIIAIIIIIIIIIIVVVAVVMNKADAALTAAAAVPAVPVEVVYTFHQGKDSYGNDIVHRTDLADKVPELKAFCNTTPDCKGFHTGGWIKKSFLPQDQWKTWTTDPNKGIYVRV